MASNDSPDPVTDDPKEAVSMIRNAGIIGCGGAGFPAHIKYQKPQPTLLVNAAESEPGYYRDKLLMQEQPDLWVNLFRGLKDLFGIERFVIAAEDIAGPYMTRLDELADETGLFETIYIPPVYKYGQEKALAKEALGIEIPKGKIPPDEGLIVNNNETLVNIYRMLWNEHPVTSKIVHVYGEARPLKVMEVPVGALARDVLEVHGTDLDDIADYYLYDGGPVLCERVMEKVSEGDDYPVRGNTNALLVVDPEKDVPRIKYYPEEGFKHNTRDSPVAPGKIIDATGEFDLVRVPRKLPFGAPPQLLVKEGEEVELGQRIAEPGDHPLTVGLNASIAGTVTKITDDWIQIES